MKKICTLLFACLSFHLIAQNALPVISNVQTALNGTVLTIGFDLGDAENDAVTVHFRAGQSGSPAYDFDTGNATGDVGPGVSPGNGKQITWDLSAYIASLPYFKLMLVADDLQPVDIQAIVEQVDSNRLYNDLAFLEGVRHRTGGAAHLEETKNMIFNRFAEHNLETYLQSFDYGAYTAANIIGNKTGTEQETSIYILGGHFDSVNNAPGADDNASAVAGMLETMRILSDYSFKKTIKYIGFDLEEAGLIGSSQYVQQGIIPGENIEGMIDFEMIGYYSEAQNSQTFPPGFNLLYPALYNEVSAEGFRGNFITNVSEADNSVPLMNVFENAAATYVPELKVKSVIAPSSWQTLTPDFGRSDHAPFWVSGIPALMLTDGANYRNPNYHTPGDTIGTLNFTFMANVVKATVAALIDLAEIQHAATWTSDVELPVATSSTEPCRFHISPNPADDTLLIQWGNCTAANAEIQLTDLQGKIHLLKNIPANGSGQYILDVSKLERGVYFLKFGNLLVKKVILN